MNELTTEQRALMEQIRRDEMRTVFIAAAIGGLCAGNIDGQTHHYIGESALMIADAALECMAAKQQAEA